MSSSLSGKRILVTRSKKQAGRLGSELEARGAIPIVLATTEILEPENWDPLDQALRNLSDFDWVVFTSSNAVEAVARRMGAIGLIPAALMDRKLAVVGPATGEALERFFRAADAMPGTFVASSVCECLGCLEDQKVLLPRGDLARADLPLALNTAGATVLEVTAYCTVPVDEKCDFGLTERPDAITFASAESARTAVVKLRQAGIGDWLSELPLVCIGPVTAESVRELGLEPAAVAAEFTIPGLIEALEKLFRVGVVA
jgi:uroporphyrinogen-III synthase